ncbi:MAG: cytochrome c-type biogenesis protein [Burkholderiales bacterium]
MTAVLLLVLALPAYANEAAPAADDPVLEQRVMRLTTELRCLVCQNQSLADSHADLAIDLKNQVRSQMQAGKSDAEIREFMVARYGDFVLYRPPLKSTTVLLWAGPFVLLAAGGLALGFYLRRRRERLTESELTPEQRARAEALLRAGQEGGAR